MQSHINEYKRMLRLQSEIEEMQAQSQELTDKIEKRERFREKSLRTVRFRSLV